MWLNPDDQPFSVSGAGPGGPPGPRHRSPNLKNTFQFSDVYRFTNEEITSDQDDFFSKKKIASQLEARLLTSPVRGM